ncbi:MAG TPA: hypothetical protein VLV18_09070 [Terriglobales bacterium]|nr:hypothetical protein [Terriglobales bacterium]
MSEQAKTIEGVNDAAVVMGTSTNKEILTKLGLLTGEGEGATESDMILAVKAESDVVIEKSLSRIQEMVLKPPSTKGQKYYSLDAALQALPDANLAIVSIPGEFARDLVLKVLDKGLNVHLFSDHVPTEHELELKQYASRRGLFVMGPGAGTVILSGKAIGFANVVRRGSVGVIAAAGTGLQEVSVLLSEAGLGISGGIGTGGGDVKEKIGGLMMLQSIEAFEGDAVSELVVVVSKPPSADVKKKLLEHIATSTKKRYVACFLGGEDYQIPQSSQNRVRGTKTLHGAIVEAIHILEGNSQAGAVSRFEISPIDLMKQASQIAKDLRTTQKYLRGLYTGGTLAYEALIILDKLMGKVYSNAPLESLPKLSDSNASIEDTVVDLGEEEFTSGRAHPMIDPTVRQLRLVEEAKHQDVAVVMMDIMLGYGSHHDPAGAMLGAIAEAKRIARVNGRALPILAHVCGTEQDPQPLSQQTKKLEEADVHVFPTNAMMTIAGALIARRGAIEEVTLRETYRSLLGAF